MGNEKLGATLGVTLGGTLEVTLGGTLEVTLEVTLGGTLGVTLGVTLGGTLGGTVARTIKHTNRHRSVLHCCCMRQCIMGQQNCSYFAAIIIVSQNFICDIVIIIILPKLAGLHRRTKSNKE